MYNIDHKKAIITIEEVHEGLQDNLGVYFLKKSANSWEIEKTIVPFYY